MTRFVFFVFMMVFIVFQYDMHRATANDDLSKSGGAVREDIASLNRIKPLQNPNFRKSDMVLGRSVVDRGNKIIGKVEDLLIDPRGNVQSLMVMFDRLRLPQPVYLSASDTKIGIVSNGYRIGYRQDEVAAVYPSLLAAVETASSGGKDEILSLRRVMGKAVLSPDTDKIGVVADVLMDKEGKTVLGFYIDLQKGGLRGKGVAVPFGMLRFEEQDGITRARISQGNLATLKNFAAKN